MVIYDDLMDIHGDLVGAKVVPQFVNAKLVQISPISLGLMDGGYIYSIHGDYKPTFTSLWGHHQKNYPVPSDRHPRCKEFWLTASWICLGQKDDLSHRRTNIGPTFSHTQHPTPTKKRLQNISQHTIGQNSCNPTVNTKTADSCGCSSQEKYVL